MNDETPRTDIYRKNVANGFAVAMVTTLRTVEIVDAMMTARAILPTIPLKVGSCHTLEYSRTVSFTFAFSPNI